MPTRRLAPALLAIALLALFPTLARADLWAAISGGAFLPSGASRFGSMQTRATASLAVGWDSEYVGGSLWAGFVNSGAGQVFTEDCFPVAVRARGRLPLGVFAPFVYGGVGFAPSRALVNMVASQTVAFTAQAGGGFDLVFGEMFTIGAEAGYLWLQPSYDFGTVDMNGMLLLATFALRFP
ncbi:MAG: hypothetical protein WCK73_09760 [Deltaproteobacteria bacterium]